MKKSIYKKNALGFLGGAVVPILFTVAVMLMIVSGLSQTKESNRVEGLRILEESIRRAVVINYAVEGSYPQSVDEIVSKYNINIDSSRYLVHYDIFASNIMPDVAVIELAEAK